MKKYITILLCVAMLPMIVAQRGSPLSGGSSSSSGGGQILASEQFKTNSSIVYIIKGALQTNGSFRSDGTTFGLKAISDVSGTQDAFRQFETTTDGSTGYKLYGNGVLKWAFNSDGTGSSVSNMTINGVAYGKVGMTALTDASTIAIDATTGTNTYRVTLGGNRILGNPTGAFDSQKFVFLVKQDATGNRTLSLDTKWHVSTTIPDVTGSTNAAYVDRIEAEYWGTEDWFVITRFVRGIH